MKSECRDILFLLLAFSFLIFFLPFYEGGARAGSLFVIHTLVFVFLGYAGLEAIREKPVTIAVPHFLVTLIPFFIYLFIRSLFSPYLYASLLSLWEIVIFFMLFMLSLHFSEKRSFGKAVLMSFFLSTMLQSLLSIVFFIQGGFKRTAVYFLNPNHLAAYLSMGLFIGSFFLLKHREKLSSAFLIPALLIILVSFMITSSRGALLSFIAASAFLIFMLRKKMKKMETIIACILLTSVALAGLFLLVQRFAGGLDIYRYERIRIWKASLEIFSDYAIFGIAPGMFKYHSLNYNFPQLSSPIQYGRYFSTPHSDYILVLIELGVIGFIILFLALLMILFRVIGRKGFRDEVLQGSEEDPFLKPLLLSIFVALLVQALFDNLTNRPALYMSLAILAGVGLHEILRKDSFRIPISCPVKRSSFILLFLLPLFFIYYLAVLSPFMGHFFSQRALRESSDNSVKALEYFDLALFFNPIHPDYYNQRGRIELRRLQKDGLSQETFIVCEEDFARAISLNRLKASYLEDMARLLRELNGLGSASDLALSRAVSYYRKAKELSPKDPFISYSMALLYRRIKDFDNAEREIMNSLKIEPYFFKSSVLLALNHIDKGEVEKARAVIETMERRFMELQGFRPQNIYEFQILDYDRELFLKIKGSLLK
ncbi:MAG: O-antigen ligase family protein [Acidobacteriota bacterium]